MSASEREADLRRISNASRAKATMEAILEENGYYDAPNGSKLRELRNLDSAKILSGDVEVEVFTYEGCPTCSHKASSIRDKCKAQGFNFKLTPLKDSEPDREWVLAQWPHIKVSGHEVTEEILEDLAVEATLRKRQQTALSK